ncbi:MAG: hypothetical protein ACK57X_08925, partial [Bacteroidota bacterium]
MKKIHLLSFLFFCMVSTSLVGQIDKTFWFAVPHISPVNGWADPAYFRIGTFDKAATVNITQPASGGAVLYNVTIPANSSSSIDVTALLNTLQSQGDDLVVNKGILISSTELISVYYDSGVGDVNPDLFALKGSNGLGKNFIITAGNFDTGYNTRHEAFVIASEDNTTITVTPKVNIQGHNAGVPYNITLQRVQVYIISSLNNGSGLFVTKAQKLGGTLISSDKPVAVVHADDLISIPNGGCGDLNGDQLIPTNLAGKEYVVMPGSLTGTAPNNASDFIFIYPIKNGVTITVNGTAAGTFNLGDFYRIDNNGTAKYITSSDSVLVYQIAGTGCEVGGAVIPSLTCTGSQTVGIVRNNTLDFKLSILTKQPDIGSFTFKTSAGIVANVITAGAFSQVGTSTWYAASIDLNINDPITNGQGAIISNSTGLFHLGVTSNTGGGTSFGYFSNFGSASGEIVNTGGSSCETGKAVLQANVIGATSYQWKRNGTILTGAAASQLITCLPGNYEVVATAVCPATLNFPLPYTLCGYTCVDKINLALGSACSSTLDLTSAVLPSDCIFSPEYYIRVNDLNPTNGAIVDGVSPPDGWVYGVYLDLDLNSSTPDLLICQGRVVATDNTPPVITAPAEVEFWCDDIDLVYKNESSWKNENYKWFSGNLLKTLNRFGTVSVTTDSTMTISDNCGGQLQILVTDRIDYTECGTSPSSLTGTVYATVTRSFEVRDMRGNEQVVTQLIKFKRPAPSMFPVIGGLSAYNTINGQTVWSTNGVRNGTAVNYSNSTTTADMIVFNSCEAPTATGAALKEVLRGYLRSLYRVGYLLPGDGASSPNADTASIFDNFCNYSVDFTYKEYANCNNGKKFEIVTKIIDWCTGVTINDPVVLSFEDASAPVFSALSTNIGSSGTTPANVLGTTAGSPIRISVGTNECKGSLRLGTAWNMRDLSSLFNLSVSDNCSADKQKISLNYKFETGDYWNDRFFQSQGWTSTDYTIVSTANGPNVIGLPIGKHRVRIIGHDGCNNRDSVTVYFDVIDNVAPVMRCDDEINVTMTSNQSSNYYLLLNKSDLDLNRHMSARLYVEDINEGSRDNCTLDSMYVRRKFNWTNCSDYMKTNMEYDAFSASGTSNGVVGVEDFEAVPGEAGMYFTPKGMQYVEYFCCDLGTGLVELWGSDTRHYNLSGGNWNFCWTKVTIEDKSDPVITAPDLAKTYNAKAQNWVNCTDKEIIGTSSITDGRIADVALSNALFGIPDIYGIECSGSVAYSVTKNLTCDTGTITRKWTVTKGSIVKSATQTIYVRANHNFSITVPGDQSATCSAKEGTEVLLDEAGCDLLAVSYSNVKYDAAPGDNFCYKIYRTATVINWCMVPNHYSCSGADPSSHAVIIPRNTGTAAVKYTFTLGSANTGRSQTALEASTAGSNVLVKGGAIAAAGESLVQGTTTASGFISPSTTNCFTKPGFAYKYTQIIKVTDDVKPTVASGTDWTPATADADKTAGINWDKTKNSFSISGSTCKANIKLSFAASDACATNDLELEKIELLDRGLDKLTPTGTSVAGTTTGTTNGLFTISASGVPVGQYDVRVTVRDDCGNVTVSRLAVDVEDNKAPAPVCVQNLTATLMPDGAGKCMVVVKAIDVFQDINRDWNAGECSPSVVASIARLTNGVEGTKAATLTLTEADKGGVTARVYLTDAAGNADFCTVIIVVEDNFCGNGGASASVAGLIQTEGKTEVEGVQVNLSGESQKQMATGVNGRYVFQNLNNGTDYTVTPSLNKGFLNGVSTYDLILISKHILGNQPLNTPYKLIAADVNNSKSITTLDMIQLRKLILNIDATFANNSSWRFVDASYTFPNAANPW